MKAMLNLHARMRAHHMRRAKEATTSAEKVYHLQLARSIETRRKPPVAEANSVDEWYLEQGPMDWRDARARWCARMRAGALARAWEDDTSIWLS
jgi:hypothetical protein